MGVNPALCIDFPPFQPRPPWLTADLQTLRNYLRQPSFDFSTHPATRIELPLNDGSGDRLTGELHRPPDPTSGRLVVVVHGLTGCADSTYVLATAWHLLRLGYSVLRLNLRGAGPTRRLSQEQYHAGRSEDLKAALAVLPQAMGADGVLAVGYSLGANMLLKYLAEQGGRGPVRAAVSVSAPIDLKAASLCMMRPRNRLYHDWLLARMRADALSSGGLTAIERRTVQSVRRVYDYDERFVAPRNGFASAEDYYGRCSARRFLPEIAVPTLVIHALDDPWIPGAVYAEFPWQRNPKLIPLLPRGGGHVGFHGLASRIPWHDRCLGLFFERFAT